MLRPTLNGLPAKGGFEYVPTLRTALAGYSCSDDHGGADSGS